MMELIRELGLTALGILDDVFPIAAIFFVFQVLVQSVVGDWRFNVVNCVEAEERARGLAVLGGLSSGLITKVR